MNEKILIADDDKDLVEVLSSHLESVGYETISAYEGVRAVELAHKEKPAVIILDWKMPTGKGSYVLESLAAKQETKHIPVIVLTGVDEQGLEDKALKLGAKAFLRKPCDFEDLLEVILKVLEG